MKNSNLLPKSIKSALKKLGNLRYLRRIPKNRSLLLQREMVRRLRRIPRSEDKIKFFGNYGYSSSRGAWFNKSNLDLLGRTDTAGLSSLDYPKINYGCGANIIAGWLNVDLDRSAPGNYRRVDVLEKHPFLENSVRYGFSEDLLEHFDQAESIFFLSEVHRTLALGGVMRLSFPGLEGVLNRHYFPASEERVRAGEFEAYSFWDHVHFYSRDELELVASHIGFSQIKFVEFGQSEHQTLRNLDTRADQIGLNTYVELTK
jgi:predicted SAM-dependent methyltransferase